MLVDVENSVTVCGAVLRAAGTRAGCGGVERVAGDSVDATCPATPCPALPCSVTCVETLF